MKAKQLEKLAILTLLLLLAIQSRAVDGVVEINQTCATQSGCFSGDTAGFPVTIDGSVGKSYRLTSDLVLPDENADGISIRSSNVSIDLNRFAIIRQACIDLPSIECMATSGGGRGVSASSTRSGVSVLNGSIIGMASNGLNLASGAQVNDVNVKWSRNEGIQVRDSSIIKNSTVHDNGEYGIVAVFGTIISDNLLYSNSDSGIFGDGSLLINNNTIHHYQESGIEIGSGSKITNNLIYSNSGNGISVSGVDGGLVYGNVVRQNGQYGLSLGSTTAYRENIITDNTLGTVTGGFNLLNNFCNTNDVCP